MKKAKSSGIKLMAHDAAIIKGMIKRGDRQHDIAAYFSVNGGRIAEIATGKKFHLVQPAGQSELPPAGAPGLILQDIVKGIKSKGMSVQDFIRS